MINTQTGIRTFNSTNYTTTGNLSTTNATITNLKVQQGLNMNLTIQKRSDIVHPVDTPLYRKFVLTTGSAITVVTLSNVDGLFINMTAQFDILIPTTTIVAINKTTNQITFNNAVTVTNGQVVILYKPTLTTLDLDYITLQGMTITITPYTLQLIANATVQPYNAVWYTGLTFVNIPTDNNCIYEFNFIIYTPNCTNAKQLSFSSSTIKINGISYNVNGYNSLSIAPITINYILQNIKILSGSTSSTSQTYTIITTIQGI